MLKTDKNPIHDFNHRVFVLEAMQQSVPAMKPKAPHHNPCPKRAKGVGVHPTVPQMQPLATEVTTKTIT